VYDISTTFTSYTLSLYPTPSSTTNPQTGPVLRSGSPFLKKDIFVCLRSLYREFHCDISMYVYIYIIYNIYYIYYNLNWFISSISFLSTLVPFFCWFQQFKNSIFILYRKYTNHIHLLNFLLLLCLLLVNSP
jgi:hypothetical protein